METCVSAPLDSITLGQAVTALSVAGSAAIVLAGIWWRSARAYSSASELLKGKAEQSAVDAATKKFEADLSALRESQRERCAACRKEVDAELEHKASKSEVIAHAQMLAEQGKALAVIQTEMAGIGKRVDELRDMVRQLLERER